MLIFPLPPWIDPGGRFFRRPLAHLLRTLVALTDRLREAVARVVGETVARVVGSVVKALLDDEAPHADDYPHRTDLDYHADPWDNRPRRNWLESRSPMALPYDDDNHLGPDDDPYRDADEPLLNAADAPPAEPPQSHRGVRALAFGCQAVAWWLLRQTGRPRVLVALGVGLATSAVAFIGGPVLFVGAGLAVTAGALCALSDVARVVTEAMDPTEQR